MHPSVRPTAAAAAAGISSLPTRRPNPFSALFLSFDELSLHLAATNHVARGQRKRAKIKAMTSLGRACSARPSAYWRSREQGPAA
jgi:hypothetical protein